MKGKNKIMDNTSNINVNTDSIQTQPTEKAKITSTGGWVVTLLLTVIPIVGLVMLFVWGFGSTQDESKKNWAKAQLIWMLVAVIISVLLSVTAGVGIAQLMM